MPNQMLRSFRFQIKLRKSPAVESGSQAPNNSPSGTSLGDGGFQECSGLEVEMDIQDYQEGGRNDGVIRRAGRAKYSPLILKRGMFFGAGSEVNRELWEWIQSVVAGIRPISRYDGIIQVMDVGENIVATWVFDRGLPAKIRGPELNAKTGEIAIEELHIAHEGLRLVRI
ncbi:phage tail protein [Methyloglobulus sp.]|uniref:phage tail protein n=1 Tax=Methyloglobulus sp. TaxID=2518622 RepID=UPI0032B810A4